MSRLSALMTDIQQCRICEAHLVDGVRPVVQAGPDAKVLIAGQAPGRKVHESGIPFDDASGDRLRQWLGVSKAEFYDSAKIAIVPMGFCFPGTGKSGDLPPRPECAAKWREPLLQELQSVELLLLVGQYAQQYHLGGKHRSVTDNVKNWQSQWPHQLSLPHPSPRNNIWLKRNPWFEQDVIPALKSRVTAILK